MQTRRGVRRHRGLAHRVVVVAGLTCFVVAVYVAVVVGGGVMVGGTDGPSPALSVLATTAVALVFARAQSAVERLASRMGHAAPATPYDVLSRFSDTVTEGYGPDLPERVSRLLAEGTGARWAQVWLTVSDRMTLAATWPAGADADADRRPPSPDGTGAAYAGRRTVAVRHGGRLLGVLCLQERTDLPLTAVEDRLVAGLAAQAGLVLQLVALRAELEQRRTELAARADDLGASRRRLIATQDAERRRLERDLHDGAQQHLVALSVNVRLAQTIAGRAPERAALLLAQQVDAADAAIETLTSLSRGIYPSRLAEDGLAPALRSAARAGVVPVTVRSAVTGRLPEAIEAALYFCGMEAVQNAAKHSGAGHVSVELVEQSDRWQLIVNDDGVGFDIERVIAAEDGAGMANMRDRLDAVGGTVTVETGSGGGTAITAVVPRPPALLAPSAPLPGAGLEA